jgi:hypothetical protein
MTELSHYRTNLIEENHYWVDTEEGRWFYKIARVEPVFSTVMDKLAKPTYYLNMHKGFEGYVPVDPSKVYVTLEEAEADMVEHAEQRRKVPR